MNFIRNNKKASLMLGGGVTYAVSVGLAYKYLTNSTRKDQSNYQGSGTCCQSFVTDPNRTNTFQNIAYKYDSDIDMDELVMGIKLMRRAMLFWHASGNVLEVGAGTGRNINFYPMKHVNRVVISDSSDKMLEVARKKVDKLGSSDRDKFIVTHLDAQKLSQFPDSSFDTVVDSFGLCSFDDPVAVLIEMKRVCKKGGKILLLEHGRSKTWDGITRHLDTNAEIHAKNWGCVWNRDIDKIIGEADLDVETKSLWHFGTTYYVVARKS